MARIDVKGTSVTVYTDNDMEFISLTDMVRDIENGLALIDKWLRNKNTIEFLGIWEEIYNPGFNSPEFEGIKNQAGLNCFVLNETAAGGYRGAQAGRRRKMTRKLHTEFIQQPVGQWPEPVNASQPGIEKIERELQGGDA